MTERMSFLDWREHLDIGTPAELMLDDYASEISRLDERLGDQVRMTLAGEAVIERLQRDLGAILNRISTAAAEDDTTGMVAALNEGRDLINATLTWSAGGQPGGGQP